MAKKEIYNLTKLPDKMVSDVVKGAKRFTRTKGYVPVIIRMTRYHGAHGIAHKCNMTNINYFKHPKSNKIKHYIPKWVLCNGGYHETWITGNKNVDPLKRAFSLFKVACHEYCHIRDFQEGEYIPHIKGSHHDSRPCELSVDNRLYDMRGVETFWEDDSWKLPAYAEKAILELAIWIEENKI